MGSMKKDFVVDTKGHCFLCLNRAKLTSDQSVSVQSIQYLSKYLKFDMSKLFKGPVPQHLLEKVERSTLKVELCSECSCINAKLHILLEQLEKVEMEIGFRLCLVWDKTNNSQAITRIEEIQEKLSIENNEDLSEKLKIAQVLREELKSKCKLKIASSIITQVKIEKTKWKKPVTKANKTINDGYDAESTESCPIILNDQIKMENNLDYTAEVNPTDDLLDSNFDNMTAPQDDSWQLSSSESPETSILKSETVRIRRKFTTGNKIIKKKRSLIGNKYNNLGISIPSPIKSAGEVKSVTFANKRVINPKNGKHKCLICSKEYSYVQGFDSHFKSDHLKVRFTCPASNCRKSCTRKHDYERHYQNKHLRIRLQCQLCSKIFYQDNHLSNHMNKTHRSFLRKK